MKEFVSLRFKNKMYVIEKLIQEPNNKAMARLWFIAKEANNNQNLSEKELISLSYIYVNEKYMQMKY